MNSCSCGRRVKGERLQRGWRVSGEVAVCVQCRRQLYRLKSISAVVVNFNVVLQELNASLEELSIPQAPGRGYWEAMVTDRRNPVVLVHIRDRCWELPLRAAAWSAGRMATFEAVASGLASGELFIRRIPTDVTRLGDASDSGPAERFEIVCRIRVWLPRGHIADPHEARNSPRDIPGPLPHSDDRLEEIAISDLRDAVRANRVSFPSQVPTFLKHDRPGLQAKAAQLYFVLGWNYGDIGARYGLTPARVRQILNAWKRRAISTGYIQNIPTGETISHPASGAPAQGAHPGFASTGAEIQNSDAAVP